VKILLKASHVVTLNESGQIFSPGYVVVEDDEIIAAGKAVDAPGETGFDKIIDAGERLIMPGMTNAHMHLYSTFARGIALKDEPPENFVQILERLWWRLDKALEPEDIYLSAMVPLIDCVKSGTTSIIDHHAGPFSIPGSLDLLADAVSKTGVRACLCYEVSDRDGKEKARQGIEENVRFIEKYQSAPSPYLKGLFGLHASFTVEPETMKKCVSEADRLGVGLHVHTAEDKADQDHCLSVHGKRVIERFADDGVLKQGTILAHCIHIDEHERALLKKSGAFSVHNPESNMGNAVGRADVLGMVAEGITVGMGTDGFTSDMFQELKVFNILHKLGERDPRVGYAELMPILFDNNRKIFSSFFDKPLAVIKPGAYADLIIMDYCPPTPFETGTFLGHLLFGLKAGMVRTVMIGGDLVMEDRQLIHLDEHEIAARSRKRSRELWERY